MTEIRRTIRFRGRQIENLAHKVDRLATLRSMYSRNGKTVFANDIIMEALEMYFRESDVQSELSNSNFK